MRRIYLLSTGGTIEKVYSEQSGIVENRAAKLDRYLRMLRLPGFRNLQHPSDEQRQPGDDRCGSGRGQGPG